MIVHPGILERVLGPQRGGFPPELARYVLALDFPSADKARYLDLSAKAQEDGLTAAERSELEDYLNINDLIAILKSTARSSLQHNTAA